MSDLTPPNPTNHIHAPSAPDPTARLDDEASKPQPHPLTRLGLPTSIDEARGYSYRHYLIKTISLLMIIHGFYNLYEYFIDIFVVFPQLPHIYKSLGFSQDVYTGLVYKSILAVATSTIESVFGLSLAFQHSRIIHNLHIVSGLMLFIISYYLNTHILPAQFTHPSLNSLACNLLFALIS